MRISAIETFTNEFICFVRLTTEDGAQGWGQTAPYFADITAQVLHRQVAPWALGMDDSNVGAIVDLVRDREHKFPGSYLRRAIGGIDTAIWDLHGKREERPVCALIGGTPGTIRAYGSSMKRDITPRDEADRFKRLRDQKGFDAFKFRVAAECGHDVEPQQYDHDDADRQHVIREFEKRDLAPDEVAIKADGDGAARGTKQGNDAAGTGGERHADE